MAATNSAFRTETRDEDLYNHLELFNMPSSSIEASAANDYQDCREQQPTRNIGKGRRMFSDYRTEPNNEHLYCNIQSINQPSSPATETQAANQTSQDDRGGKQPTGNSKTMGRRVSSAMIAVLALAFLAMVASLIALKWELVKSSGTNGCQDCRVPNGIKEQLNKVDENIGKLLHDQTEARTGCRDGLLLDRMKQELNEVEKNVTEMVAKIIDQVLTNQTEERRLLEKKIENQTSELKGEIRASQENQTTAIKDKILTPLKLQIKNLEDQFIHLVEDRWIKVNNSSPICFGAKDNNVDFLVPYSGKLASVKLVHLNGAVTCDNTHWSFWGCGGKLEDVNVEIKNLSGTTILSLREFSTGGELGVSSQNTGYNSSSPELVLSACSNPQSVTAGQKLRLTYGQKLPRITRGRSCGDVYVRLMS